MIRYFTCGRGGGRVRSITNAAEYLQTRGCIADTTPWPDLVSYLSEPRPFYCGFDPTADSLHVGNLSMLMTMRRLQEFGHKPIALIGGATGLIGDPSGRDSERPLMSHGKIEENTLSISNQIRKFLDFSEGISCRAEIVNNIDWYRDVDVITFLREIGKHFKIATMLSRECVKSRMDSHSGLTLTEFCYQSLQGCDFYTLAQRYGCFLQIGGSDQWGNIVSGINFIREKMDRKAHGLTVPLIKSKTGVKLGKSTGGGSIWLCPNKTSAYSLYQYFVNTDDDQVFTLLKMLSPLSLPEIESLRVREAQIKLAESLTELIHGEEGLKQARSSSQQLFRDDRLDLSKPLEGVPEIKMSPSTFLQSDLISVLVNAKIATSRSEGRRLLEGGGVSINGQRQNDPKRKLDLDDLQSDACLIQIGKRKRFVIRTNTIDPSNLAAISKSAESE